MLKNRRWSVVLAGALALLASLPTSGQASTARPVTIAQLRSAPVPALCTHPAGRLVRGSLPGIPQGDGFVTMPAATGQHGHDSIASGDLNGDGVADVAVAVYCNIGGVPWPSSVQLYTSGAKRLGGISLEKISHGDRDFVRSLSISHGAVTVDWSTNRASDYGCCSTLDYAAQLRVSDGKLRISHATPYDERPTFRALLVAAPMHDLKTLRRLATPALASELDGGLGWPGTKTPWHCYGSPSLDLTWPAATLDTLGIAKGDSDVSWDVPGDRYCVNIPFPGEYTLLRLEHTGYRTWRADHLEQFLGED